MTMNYKIATIFGGTGFVGRQIVRDLAKEGYIIKIATRVPERAYFLRTCGSVGQIVPFAYDYSQDSLAKAVEGSQIVVNCIGTLYDRKKNNFQKIHAEIPGMIASASRAANVQRFVHISALGIVQSSSRYARSKMAGEDVVLANFPAATILRPSVIFGEDDTFFNRFAKLAAILPALPLIGGGKTKFQPVYVGDVAKAVMAAATLPIADDGAPLGRVYELGGPDVVDFRQIYQTLFSHTHQRRALLPLPYGIAKIQASFMGILPNAPLTPDQVESLKTDSVVTPGALGLQDLGVVPTSMSLILPTYLERYRPGGRFADQKHA